MLEDEDAPAIADDLREMLRFEKHRYIESRKEQGGTAEGFRQRIRRQYARAPEKFVALVLDSLMEAATKSWQEPARKHGKDLFSIAGVAIPEFITRPAGKHISGDDGDEQFEKVSQKFATVADFAADVTIKLRKAAQASAAANELAQALDEARRRSRGHDGAFLHDVMDDAGDE